MTILLWRYVTGGLGSALLLSLVWGARVDHLRGEHKAARQDMQRQFIDSQRQAQAAFDAQIAALKTRNRRLNNAAQKQNDDLRIVYRDRVIRLPATMNCPPMLMPEVLTAPVETPSFLKEPTR